MCLIVGTILKTPFDIHQAAVDYFQSFLAASSSRVLADLSWLIFPIINAKENRALNKEVMDALFSIPINSSPGSDGFGFS